MYALIGDSHTGPIVQALRSMADVRMKGGPLLSAVAACRTFFRIGKDDIVVTQGQASENYKKWKQVTNSAGVYDFPHRMVVSMGLAGVPIFGAAEMWRQFTLGEGTAKLRPISKGLFDNIVSDMQQHVLAFYKHLIERDLIACAVEGPPPQARDLVVQEFGPDVIIDLDRRYRRPVVDFLSEHNVPIVAVTADDGRGLLREEYWGYNSRHGNAEYGRLVVTAVLELLDSRGREA